MAQGREPVIFIFSNFYEKYFEKIRKRQMAQGRVPSPMSNIF